MEREVFALGYFCLLGSSPLSICLSICLSNSLSLSIYIYIYIYILKEHGIKVK